MTTRTTLEFARATEERTEDGETARETVNAEVATDDEAFRVELPTGGRWECDQEELRSLLD